MTGPPVGAAERLRRRMDGRIDGQASRQTVSDLLAALWICRFSFTAGRFSTYTHVQPHQQLESSATRWRLEADSTNATSLSETAFRGSWKTPLRLVVFHENNAHRTRILQRRVQGRTPTGVGADPLIRVSESERAPALGKWILLTTGHTQRPIPTNLCCCFLLIIVLLLSFWSRRIKFNIYTNMWKWAWYTYRLIFCS